MEPADRFEPYGTSHLAVLVLFVLAAVILIRMGRRLEGRVGETRLRRGLALLLLSVQLALQIYSMLPANWDLGHSLPFQLCDLAWMAAVVALWSGRGKLAFGLLYYWGLTLTTQALITPNLEFDFPHPQFIMFWFSHCLVVLAALLMTWGLEHRPGWKHFFVTGGFTVCWGFLMMAFNHAAGTNYLFVNHKPEAKSILDLLGPWPAYVFWEMLIMVAVWAVMTFPWVVLGKRK